MVRGLTITGRPSTPPLTAHTLASAFLFCFASARAFAAFSACTAESVEALKRREISIVLMPHPCPSARNVCQLHVVWWKQYS